MLTVRSLVTLKQSGKNVYIISDIITSLKGIAITNLQESNNFQDLRDNNGSNCESESAGVEGAWSPDSNSAFEKSSRLCLSNRWKRLGLSSSSGSAVLAPSFMLCTCWRQTWTASCTLTKYHSLPISSTKLAFARVSRTSRFGLEMAIYKVTQKVGKYIIVMIFSDLNRP